MYLYRQAPNTLKNDSGDLDILSISNILKGNHSSELKFFGDV